MLYVAKFRDERGRYKTALLNNPGRKKAMIYFNRTHKNCEIVSFRESRRAK